MDWLMLSVMRFDALTFCADIHGKVSAHFDTMLPNLLLILKGNSMLNIPDVAALGLWEMVIPSDWQNRTSIGFPNL